MKKATAKKKIHIYEKKLSIDKSTAMKQIIHKQTYRD